MSKYYYQNSRGETIDLCASPFWVVSFNPLRSYEYERIEENGVFFGHRRRRNVVKPLQVQFYNADRAEWLRFRDKLYRIVNYDLIADKYGRIYDGEWYGVGNFPAETIESYDRDRGLWTATLGFFMPEEVWVREVHSYIFDGAQTGASSVPAIPSANYPDNYPHGYTSGNTEQFIVNDSAFPSPFRLTIEGACSNPSITIGSHIYNVNVYVPSGGKLIIDSTERTIILYDSENEAESMFQYQNHDADKYVFEPIQTGENISVRYQNIPRVILTVMEERSAAKWS